MREPRHVPSGYAVGQRLGAGQTSVVWLATHERTKRPVALKLPREEAQTDPVLRRMFENEVQITLKLDHPNVVRAFDGRPTGPHAFLALEYCEGGTLDQLLLEQGKLPMARALQLVGDVAAGLQHTHEQRVLHRDVKPANVFLDGEGRAKLGDFGTGTFAAEESQERVGTAFYMAPEIFQGTAPTVRSDIYSLGVLSYEVLSGERPFRGDSYDALMVGHLTSLPRDLRHLRRDLPQGVGTVVTKAMSRDFARRYQTVRAFLEAFESATGKKAPPTPPPDAARAAEAGRSGRRTQTGAPALPKEGPGPRKEQKEEPRGILAWLRRRRR